jgi:hypothetical protein
LEEALIGFESWHDPALVIADGGHHIGLGRGELTARGRDGGIELEVRSRGNKWQRGKLGAGAAGDIPDAVFLHAEQLVAVVKEKPTFDEHGVMGDIDDAGKGIPDGVNAAEGPLQAQRLRLCSDLRQARCAMLMGPID